MSAADYVAWVPAILDNGSTISDLITNGGANPGVAGLAGGNIVAGTLAPYLGVAANTQIQALLGGLTLVKIAGDLINRDQSASDIAAGDIVQVAI
jgi:hypothetical protein